MQGTQVLSLGREDPLENSMDRGAWQATVHAVAKDLDVIERVAYDWVTLFLLFAVKDRRVGIVHKMSISKNKPVPRIVTIYRQGYSIYLQSFVDLKSSV